MGMKSSAPMAPAPPPPEPPEIEQRPGEDMRRTRRRLKNQEEEAGLGGILQKTLLGE